MPQKIDSIYFLLSKAYGTPKKENFDSIETLVLTILSQNTNDKNRDIAYSRLRKKFRSWESIRKAPLASIEGAIRQAGLSKSKSRSIKLALGKIKKEQGKYSLEFLRKKSLEDARQYLLSFKGVGPKTAAVVLCFSLDKPAFPVDTHIYRVSKRLGLIHEKTTVEKAHKLLEATITPELRYSLHFLLIKHGREICHARTPECPKCALRKICAYKNKTFA
ncbi:MAG: endonuclease III [Candidatus Micrarchaeota archaeon]